MKRTMTQDGSTRMLPARHWAGPARIGHCPKQILRLVTPAALERAPLYGFGGAVTFAGLGVRPKGLFGFLVEPVGGSPCSLTGSITLGRSGLPSAESLAGLAPTGN